MKLLDTLFIEFADFLAAGWKEDTVKKANLRNGPFWQMIPDPADKRKVLVQYDTLRPKDQERLTEHFGNPYEYIAKAPIKLLVTADYKAENFYKTYRYNGINDLPVEHQARYTKAASWLNMLVKLNDDKRMIKKELNLSLEKFWLSVCDIIKTDNIELPFSYHRLLAKIKEYKEQGYSCLIDWRFGNKNTAKIGKTDEGFCIEREQQQVAIIRKVARLHMNLDAVQITTAANSIFEKNKWETVSPATVANLVNKHMPNIIAQKRGEKVFNNKVTMQVKRLAPDFPTLYWTLDGWTVELLYQDGKKFNNRLVMVVVLDACNKYPVGYAIGERENTELIRMALRNAVIHMQDLFGATYRPWQLQSDRYGMKNLTPFYGAVAHIHTPAAVGNAKAKIIEPYFKYLNKNYCQKHPNWSGFNITSSKDNQPNIERLDQIKLSFPTKEGVIEQINRFMLKERLSKVEDYRNRWDNMPAEDQVTLTQMECIEVFGQAHTELNSIIGIGLIATLQGQELTYDSFDPAFRNLQFTTRFKIMYDACDLNQVLAITDDGKQKFLLHKKVAVGMGYKNTTPEQLAYHDKLNDFNHERKEQILQTYIIDDAIVEDIIAHTPLNLSNDDEAALKLMFTTNGQQKEQLQDAKGLRKIQQQISKAEQKAEQKQDALESSNWQDAHQQYLQSKTDINQYLD